MVEFVYAIGICLAVLAGGVGMIVLGDKVRRRNRCGHLLMVLGLVVAFFAAVQLVFAVPMGVAFWYELTHPRVGEP
jgi:hypothetical protein